MDTKEISQAVAHWLASLGYASSPDSTRSDALRTQGGDQEWFVVLRGDQPAAVDYLRQFDDAIDALITVQSETDLPPKFAVAVAFTSTLSQVQHSYRAALKKYSNSIIFTDLAINLLLVRDDRSLEVIPPEEVNPFLRDLNRYILAAN